jgi:ATP-binding protein involved in chromosome partitioning
MQTITNEAVLQALRVVRDPDLGRDIVTLGFVKNVRIWEGNVAVDLELTTPACPVKDRLQSEAVQALKGLPGVTEATVTLTAQVRRSQAAPAQGGLKDVKNIIAVASGKGGVGKSTVAVNLAIALSRAGAKVGLMDADVYGPSVPIMLAGLGRPETRDNKLVPLERYGVKFMSMGLLTEDRSPVIWRGPMASKLIQQFLADVEWGDLDYLLIDLPPGTGDVQLTLTQAAPLTGAVLVTTPQEVAVGITVRGLKMFQQVQVPVLGIVENMSYFFCPHCEERTEVFRHGGGERASRELGLRFLGAVPLDPKLVLASDLGRPVVGVDAGEQPPSAEAFNRISRELAAQVSIINEQTAAVKIAPTEVSAEDGHVVVKWQDGEVSRYPFYELRCLCPCALCVDEWTGQRRLEKSMVSHDVKAAEIRPVGRYAMQVSWSDGHSTGIYSYDKLREMSDKGIDKVLGRESFPSATAAPPPLAAAKVPAESASVNSPNTPVASQEAASGPGSELRKQIIEALCTVFDPEIPVNIYELGLVYDIDVKPTGEVDVRMTLTSAGCPAAEIIPSEVERKVKSVPGVKATKVEVVWDPPWNPSMMSEAARLQLNLP